MKSFDIFDTENSRSLGTLLCYEREKTFIVELMEDTDEWTAPLLFTAYVKKGIYTIPREVSLAWISERLIPPGRQNISSILANHHLKEYDELKLLEISEGICCQDSIVLKKTDALPDYVIDRMNRNLAEFVLTDDSVLVFFNDNTVKKIKLSAFTGLEGAEKLEGNPALLQSGRIGAGGYYVTFNNSIDIAASKLYTEGITIPLKLKDFLYFVRNNVSDTTDVCNLLSCSRQNVAYLVGKEQLSPLRTDVKGNLYVKGDVLRTNW